MKRILLALALALALTAPVSAQQRDAPVFVANVAFGAAIGYTYATLEGERTALDGALYGASAGALLYGAKMLVADDAALDGAVGRIIALGALSVATGHARFSLGPLVYEDGEVRVNLARAAALAYFVADSRFDFDARESLRALAPVFVREGRYAFLPNVAGLSLAGVSGIGRTAPASTLGHERVHALQHDAMSALFSPLERRLLGSLGRYIELGAASLVLDPYFLHELEADALDRESDG